MEKLRMNPLDGVWLMMESHDTPMHLGVLAILELPARAGRGWVNDLAASLREQRDAVPPWNCRLTESSSAALGYTLREEHDIDIDYHFRHLALPAPGGERELGRMVSRLHSVALERGKALWEFHLIEGLERNRFAIYLKVHHALVEDVNAVPLLLAGFSQSVRARKPRAFWTCPPPGEEAAGLGAEIAAGLKDPAGVLGGLARAASGLTRGALMPRASGSMLVPRGTPRSTLNRRINSQRRFATQQFSQERIQRLADATDSTLNEILTYLCGSSLRRFFKEYNALPDESLVGVIPVSLAERGERLPGNAIAGLRVALGTHIGDPLARLDAVKDSVAQVREDRASLPEESVTAYTMLRAAPIYASQMPGVGRLVPPLFNLGVSNTHAADSPLYFNGARLEAVYPMNALMQFSALSIDCVSYAGTFNIGFTGARDTLPHLQRMAVYLGRAVEDLEELLQLEEAS